MASAINIVVNCLFKHLRRVTSLETKLVFIVWELGPKKFDFSDIFGGELQHDLF